MDAFDISAPFVRKVQFQRLILSIERKRNELGELDGRVVTVWECEIKDQYKLQAILNRIFRSASKAGHVVDERPPDRFPELRRNRVADHSAYGFEFNRLSRLDEPITFRK